VIDVNQYTLALFRAESKEQLLGNLDKVFRDEMRVHFHDELAEMWAGKLAYEGEGVNYALDGEATDIHLRWSILPGYEETWARALVSITDVTARKKAERYMQYLGTHDVMTGLYNRAYFEEERGRLERGRRHPVSIVVADLDGLKQANDTLGHEAGDDLLRRAAEVLKAAFRKEDLVARIGGDEFAILMPDTDEAIAVQAVQRIQGLIRVNNNFYQGAPLGMSVGVATAQKGAALAEVQRLADDRMYSEKRAHHRQRR